MSASSLDITEDMDRTIEQLRQAYEDYEELWRPILANNEKEVDKDVAKRKLHAVSRLLRALVAVIRTHRRQEQQLALAVQVTTDLLTEQAHYHARYEDTQRLIDEMLLENQPSGQAGPSSLNQRSAETSEDGEGERGSPSDPFRQAGAAIAGVATFHGDGTGSVNFS